MCCNVLQWSVICLQWWYWGCDGLVMGCNVFVRVCNGLLWLVASVPGRVMGCNGLELGF